jgi:hypothetical protein
LLVDGGEFENENEDESENDFRRQPFYQKAYADTPIRRPADTFLPPAQAELRPTGAGGLDR